MKSEFQSSGKRGLAVSFGLVLLCLLRSSSARAQTEPARQDLKPTWRLLTTEEGRLVVSAAWALKQPAPGTQDCSHLIHAVYKNAGFDYEYDSSFDLYSGNESFVRVKFPRAGDLIVWPGHVGVVVDPKLHSFYSLVSTGLQEQNYEGPYWKARGVPHFFRYKVRDGSAVTMEKAAPELPPPKNSRSQDETGRSSEDPSLADAKALKTSTGVDAVYWTSIPSELIHRTPFQIPTSVVVADGSKPPTREEVAEGISELSDAAGSALRMDGPLKEQFPVVIIEQFSVKHVDTKRDRGWARLEIDSRVLISGGRSQLKARREEVRWELRRTDSGWEAVAPADRTYVAHDVAVRNLAAQLARLTESDPIAGRKDQILRLESQLANALDALLRK